VTTDGDVVPGCFVTSDTLVPGRPVPATPTEPPAGTNSCPPDGGAGDVIAGATRVVPGFVV
jgi:hypothetical protein